MSQLWSVALSKHAGGGGEGGGGGGEDGGGRADDLVPQTALNGPAVL